MFQAHKGKKTAGVFSSLKRIMLVSTNPRLAEWLQGLCDDLDDQIAVLTCLETLPENLSTDESKQDFIILDYETQKAHVVPLLQKQEQKEQSPPIVVLLQEKDPELARELVSQGASDVVVAGSLNAPFLERILCYLQEKQARQREVARHQSEKRQEASFDSLTSLANRRLFLKNLYQAIERNKRISDYHYAVLFIDLDQFKMINDSLGHSAGDQLLVQVAERLEVSIRAIDTVSRIGMGSTQQFQLGEHDNMVARFGGDEFAVLLENVETPRDAVMVAQRLRDALEKAFHLQGHEVYTSASIGIAHSKAGYSNPEDLMRDADIAMYRSKEEGKARCTLFDTAMHEQVKERLQLEMDLRKALEREELELHYQPVLCLQSGKVSGFEALLRWRRPGVGWVSPLDFIPVAEETGLIVPLGDWALLKACQQLKYWHETISPHLTMGINVSGKQLMQPQWAQSIEASLLLTGVNPQAICLEVTESSIMQSKHVVMMALEQIRSLGIRVQIDDFGTGYSSLSRLHLLPIDTLKIDRSFVQNMEAEPASVGIIAAIVTLAQTLSLDVVVEGIETEHQLEHIKKLNCRYGQGYYFARPLPPQSIPSYLNTYQISREEFLQTDPAGVPLFAIKTMV